MSVAPPLVVATLSVNASFCRIQSVTSVAAAAARPLAFDSSAGAAPSNSHRSR